MVKISSQLNPPSLDTSDKGAIEKGLLEKKECSSATQKTIQTNPSPVKRSRDNRAEQRIAVTHAVALALFSFRANL